MKYQKPEVTVLADAVDAVQCRTRKASIGPDCVVIQPNAAAYEADE
jgi:hypothetical protein